AVSGVVDPPEASRAALTLGLETGGKLDACATLAGPPLPSQPTADDYLRLSQPAAVWIQYEVGRVLSRGKIAPDEAESYAYVREGLDRHLERNDLEARAAYEKALELYDRNWAAKVNLAVTEARLSQRYD